MKLRHPFELSSMGTKFLEIAPLSLLTHGAVFQTDSNPIAFIPKIHPDCPDIEICDDKNELTVYFVDITHCHFNNFLSIYHL